MFWKSLQACRLSENMTVIDDHIRRINSPQILGHLKAMKAILEMLFTTSPGDDDKLCRTTVIPFDYGYQLYLSYSYVNPEGLMNNFEYRNDFKVFLCHEKFGLCVYIFQGNIILKPDDIDLDNLFKLQFDAPKKLLHSRIERLHLSENLPRMIQSMDSEWDRKLLKVVVGAQHSHKELEDLGIRSHDIKAMTDSVMKTLDEVDEMKSLASESVAASLKVKITHCDEKILKLERKKKNVMMDWTQVQLNELQQDIDDLKNHKTGLQSLQTAEGKTEKYRLAAMKQNELKKLVRERCLKRRKRGSGRKLAMDELYIQTHKSEGLDYHFR